MAEGSSSTAHQRPTTLKNRSREASLRKALNTIGHQASHHSAGKIAHSSAEPSSPLTPKRTSSPKSKRRSVRLNQQNVSITNARTQRSVLSSLWNDIQTLRWMKDPGCSFKLLAIPLVLYGSFEFSARYLFTQPRENPFAPLLFISYYLPDSDPSDARFDKGWLDTAFLGYYIVFFSFVRQFVTLHIMTPLAKSLGVKGKSKLDRFAEQGYAVLYWGTFGSLGIYVMSGLPTWWFKTEHFWLEYPQWRMTGLMKSYYLLQAAYWSQQLLVMALGLEKPRKDFTELVIHHIVTIYLIGASYITNMTWIGNAVFITMDVSDTFFALAKIFNYLKMNRSKFVAFTWFTMVWTYLRHWLNIVMLYSIWFEFDLIPEKYMRLDIKNHAYMPQWVWSFVFFPLLLLQLVNLFWYFLIMRILVRAICSPDPDQLDDDRSEDEDSGDNEGEGDQ